MKPAAAAILGCAVAVAVGVTCILVVRPAPRPCTPRPPVADALTRCRNVVTFSPPRPFDPEHRVNSTESELRRALTTLHDEGFRGIVTYSMDGTLREVPRIAKEIGFTLVVAGLFWYDDQQLARERPAVMEELGFIDGLVLGNEGLQFGRYTRQRLEIELARLRSDSGKPVATTEPLAVYQRDPSLLALGDFVFPTHHPFLHHPATIEDAVRIVEDGYRWLTTHSPHRPVVIKEAWWPTAGGGPHTTMSAQVEFFRRLWETTSVRALPGEAYDGFFKTTEGPHGPAWGWHDSSGRAKPIIDVLKRLYTGAYRTAR